MYVISYSIKENTSPWYVYTSSPFYEGGRDYFNTTGAVIPCSNAGWRRVPLQDSVCPVPLLGAAAVVFQSEWAQQVTCTSAPWFASLGAKKGRAASWGSRALREQRTSGQRLMRKLKRKSGLLPQHLWLFRFCGGFCLFLCFTAVYFSCWKDDDLRGQGFSEIVSLWQIQWEKEHICHREGLCFVFKDVVPFWFFLSQMARSNFSFA